MTGCQLPGENDPVVHQEDTTSRSSQLIFFKNLINYNSHFCCVLWERERLRDFGKWM